MMSTVTRLLCNYRNTMYPTRCYKPLRVYDNMDI
jgi:hypothetical protein